MLKHLNEPKTISEAALYPNLYVYQKVDAVISQVNVVSESSDVLFHNQKQSNTCPYCLHTCIYAFRHTGILKTRHKQVVLNTRSSLTTNILY